MKSSNALRISNTASTGPLSRVRKQFNTLVKKLESTRTRLADWQETMPLVQRRVDEEYDPSTLALDAQLRKMVALLDQMYSHKSLTKKEREKLADWIGDTAADLLDQSDDDEELKEIFQRHTGVNLDDEDEEDEADEMFAETMAAVLGVKLDPNAKNTREALAEALTAHWEEHAAQERAVDEARAAKAAKRPKTAAAIAREAQQAAEADKLKQSVREIFRKLASELHPDRETDPAERERKTALMQRVNVAYGANDILGLLQLQLEVEQIDVAGLHEIGEDRIKQYNKILTGQINEIEREVFSFEAISAQMLGHMGRARQTPALLMKTLTADIAQLQEDARRIEEDLENFKDVKKLKVWLKTSHLSAYDDDFDFY